MSGIDDLNDDFRVKSLNKGAPYHDTRQRRTVRCSEPNCRGGATHKDGRKWFCHKHAPWGSVKV